MPLQFFVIFAVAVACFVLLIFFREHLNKYTFAHPKRTGFLLFVAAFAGKFFLYILPFYALFFFFREYKASQAVADTASSKISSAAQGYVEIIGQGLAEEAILAPAGRQRCLWYSFEEHAVPDSFISRLYLNTDKWELIDSGVSDMPFVITDGSAKCYVDPKGAQISDIEYQTWFEGPRYYKLGTLVPDKPIYVLGDFITQTEGQLKSENSRKIGELIAEWKLHYPSFIKRFDLDGDGEISGQELDLVKMQAVRELKQQGELASSLRNFISKPQDRRPFVISHHPHSTLIKRHRWHAWFYLALFVFSLSILGASLVKTPHVAKAEENYPVGWAPLDIDEYHLSCPNLTGLYQVQSNAGNRTIEETFLGDVFNESKNKPYYRNWDFIAIHEEETSSNQTLVIVTGYRKPETIRAYEADLKTNAPELYWQYKELKSPEVRAQEHYRLQTEGGYYDYSPRNMSSKKWEQTIDQHFLGSSHRWELRKSELPYNCRDGRVVSNLKLANGTPFKWAQVGVTRDTAGNLIAKTYYTEKQNWNGFSRPDKVVVLDWSRFPKADEATLNAK